jgi:hypothetical protein
MEDFMPTAAAPADYRDRLEAGVTLVRQAGPEVRLAVAECSDPFSAALDLPPVKGRPAWLVINDWEDFAATCLAHPYTHVLVPASNEARAAAFANPSWFVPVGENDFYRLYQVRRSERQAPPTSPRAPAMLDPPGPGSHDPGPGSPRGLRQGR